jgi:hypothetical protein
LLRIAIVAGFSAPIMALVLAIAAPTKVAGFAVVKAITSVNLLPVVAYFVPRPLQFIAGIFPTYWPMRALWSAAAGEVYGAYLVIGILTSMTAATTPSHCRAWLLRFRTVTFRAKYRVGQIPSDNSPD